MKNIIRKIISEIKNICELISIVINEEKTIQIKSPNMLKIIWEEWHSKKNVNAIWSIKDIKPFEIKATIKKN